MPSRDHLNAGRRALRPPARRATEHAAMRRMRNNAPPGSVGSVRGIIDIMIIITPRIARSQQCMCDGKLDIRYSLASQDVLYRNY
jgi:hypothetical protein